MKFDVTALARKFGFSDPAYLETAIEEAGLSYDGLVYWADDAKRYPDTMHELAAPLGAVIVQLDREGNRPALLSALGGASRLEVFERDLERLRRAIPPPPEKVKGRPPKSHDLVALIRRLANAWVEGTGKRFTLDWHKGKPVSEASQFISAVTEVFAPDRLGELPNAARQVAAARKR